MTELEDKTEQHAKLAALKDEHRALDATIAGEGEDGPIHDQIALRRLKKRKLILKDEIQRLLDELHPDIIA